MFFFFAVRTFFAFGVVAHALEQRFVLVPHLPRERADQARLHRAQRFGLRDEALQRAGVRGGAQSHDFVRVHQSGRRSPAERVLHEPTHRRGFGRAAD